MITHPDAQLHILSPVYLHPLIQQADLFKVQPVHHKAANQGRTPGELKMGKIRLSLCIASVSLLAPLL